MYIYIYTVYTKWKDQKVVNQVSEDYFSDHLPCGFMSTLSME